MKRYDGDILILGNGEIIKDGSVVIDGDKIAYCGENEHAPSNMETVQSPVIMPGIWETHAHYTGIYQPALEATVFTNPNLASLRSVQDVQETLRSGITSVREVGGLGIYLNKAISEGIFPGPRIYSAGKVLSTTGGHGDIHKLNLDVLDLLNHISPLTLGEIVDGVPECYKGVRKQIREGAEVIKYCASGGVMSEIDHPIHQQFSIEEQKAIVEEANRADIGVAAHCHGAPGIKAALDAGVTSIEHGTFLDEDLANQMIEQDTVLVPTRYVIEKLVIGAEKMGVPDYAMEKLRGLYDQHADAIKLAIRKEVKIAMGCDIFTSGPGIFRHGENLLELEYLVNFGMSTTDAIIAATSHGPLTLGKRAPKSGLLKEGYDADLLLLKKNPLDDITILQDRENFTAIIKNGKVIE